MTDSVDTVQGGSSALLFRLWALQDGQGLVKGPVLRALWDLFTAVDAARVYQSDLDAAAVDLVAAAPGVRVSVRDLPGVWCDAVELVKRYQVLRARGQVVEADDLEVVK